MDHINRSKIEALSIAQTKRSEIEASTLFLAKVFNWMAVGLGLTGLIAYLTASSPAMLQLIFGNKLIFFGLIFGELGLVLFLSGRLQALSAATATGLFLAYSALNGLTLSVILISYTMTSVAATFFITAGMFASMAIYGFVTKKDLTGLGSFMVMGLIGMILASVVNIFVGNSMVSWVVSAIGVIVFTGLTAYDVQRITRMGNEISIMADGEAAMRKGAIMGALTLYLDFINLFLSLLRFLGSSRD